MLRTSSVEIGQGRRGETSSENLPLKGFELAVPD